MSVMTISQLMWYQPWYLIFLMMKSFLRLKIMCN